MAKSGKDRKPSHSVHKKKHHHTKHEKAKKNDPDFKVIPSNSPLPSDYHPAQLHKHHHQHHK
jgi:hypothetical protein